METRFNLPVYSLISLAKAIVELTVLSFNQIQSDSTIRLRLVYIHCTATEISTLLSKQDYLTVYGKTVCFDHAHLLFSRCSGSYNKLRARRYRENRDATLMRSRNETRSKDTSL